MLRWIAVVLALWGVHASAWGAPDGELTPPKRFSDPQKKVEQQVFFQGVPHLPKPAPLDDVRHADAIEALSEQVANDVVKATGVSFLYLPPVAAEPREAVLRRLAAYQHTTVEALLQDEVLSGAVALYVPSDGRIYVFVDDVGDRDARRQEAASQPNLPCVLAHELTHALQHQRTMSASREEADLEREIVIQEGHAEWVMGRVCGWMDDDSTPLNPGWPRQMRPPPDSTVAGIRYGHGLRFFQAVASAWGEAAMWGFLANPPAVDVVLDVSALGMAEDWMGDEDIRDLATVLGAPADEIETTDPPTDLLLRSLNVGWSGNRTRTRAHQATWYRDSQHAWLSVLDMGTDAAAQSLVRLAEYDAISTRDSLAVSSPPLLGASVGYLTGVHVAHPRARAKAAGADSVLQVRYLATGRGRSETWAAKGPIVTLLIEDGEGLATKLVDAALAPVLARPLPEFRVDRIPDPELVRAHVPKPASFSPDSVSLSWFASVAIPLTIRKGLDLCGPHAQAVVDTAVPGERLLAVKLAHLCAVTTEDLKAADSFAHELTWDTLMPAARAEHAGMLGRAGRWAEAAAMLKGWTPADADIAKVVRIDQIAVAMHYGRWSEAVRLAADPTLDPAFTATVGWELIRVGWTRDGRALVARACRILPDEEKAELCF